jgi:hypothetical protein
MPYRLMQHSGNGKFEVVNVESGKRHGKTTKGKAESQMRLLRAIEYGWKPKKK